MGGFGGRIPEPPFVNMMTILDIGGMVKMDGININVKGNIAKVVSKPSKITTGTVGLPVSFTFDEQWDGLSKTAVFLAGHMCKISERLDTEAIVPWELLEIPGAWLHIGVYGANEDGTIVIPTIFASIGAIVPGANPGGDPGTDPKLPVYQAILDDIGDPVELNTNQKDNLVNAINEVYSIALAGGVETDPTLSKEGLAADAAAVGDALANHPGQKTANGGEIFNFYTDPVYTGDNPPKEYPGNTANKGAHAQNFGTHADGEYSSASGWNSTASGGIANASGRETLASGYASTTEGWSTKAGGSCSHAGGKESEATGVNAYAFGLKAKATNSQSFAVGNEAEATGLNAFAHGLQVKATASQSYAGGKESEATGVNTFAYGYKAKATSNTSFAIGEETEASGYYAVATGYRTKASGTCSTANGRETEAQQYAASAQGRGTIATARNQSVRGAYNTPDTVDGNGNGNYADIVGGGKNNDDRKNIYTLDWDGNGWFRGNVYVGNGIAEHNRLAMKSEVPTVYTWARAVNKPTYTANEVGAVPTSRTINGNPLTKNVVLDANMVGAVPASRTVNGKALSSNISLTASDVGARPSDWKPSATDIGLGDYIVGVETGSANPLRYTSGEKTYSYNFTYVARKWNSGLVEIFGTSDEFEVSITKAWGSLYESGAFSLPSYNVALKSLMFCQVTFAATPSSNTVAWVEGALSNSLTSPGSTYLCRADHVQSAKGRMCVHTVGTWK